ncbi:MAG: RIP metalloprotease RseP [Verrucomicrobiae bacterium]|nr:RIP metalloprotease RseP [Verrucomicrobiae bacterium]
MTILNAIYVAAAVIALFGAAIFVHEFGHFIAARLCGMKVEAFAIGFGPKLVKWVRAGVEYSIRLFPAGGFVRLPQMGPIAAFEGSSDSAGHMPPAPALAKIIVSLAGPAMNLVFAFVVGTVVWIVGLPEAVNPPIIGYVEPESEEARLGIMPGDKIVMVDGRKVHSWQEVHEVTALARTNILPVVIERAGVQTTYHLRAVYNETIGLKLLQLEPSDHPEILEVKPNSAAEAAGLKVGDKVLAFAGVPIAGREQLVKLIEQRPDQPTEIKIERDNKKLMLVVKPVRDPVSGKGRLGVLLGPSTTQVYVLKRPGPAPWIQLRDSLGMTLRVLGALIHSKQTGVGPSDLSGPVGIIAVLAAQVNTDLRLALRFFVLLSAGLAVINMLPLPVLDGGHILFALVEKLRGRPLNAKFVEYTYTAFAALLIGFMLYVTVFDFKRLPLFGSWLKTKAKIEQAEPAPPK